MKSLFCILLFMALPESDGKDLLDKALSGCDNLERLEKVERLLDKYGVLEDVPLQCPLKKEYRISSPFGFRTHPLSGQRSFHGGVDMAVTVATPVYATASGMVAFAGRKGGYGRCVILKHAYGFSTLYGHLIAYYVKKGQPVKAGQPVGFVGSTGRSTGNHLHYETRKNGKPIKPYWRYD